MTTPRTARRPAARHPADCDMTDSIGRFAREQPTAILVGAALAGFALGRFFLYSTEPAGRRRSRNRREVHEVHGMVAGAVPSTGQTAVAGRAYGD